MAYNTLDGTTSVYNLENHIPVPTVAYYEAITGINLVTEGKDSESVAKEMLGLTLQARDFLFMDKSASTRQVMEYLIAFYANWRKAFILYAVRYIEATFTVGDEHILKNSDVPKLVKNAVNDLLNTYHFDYSTIYRVETSVEEW